MIAISRVISHDPQICINYDPCDICAPTPNEIMESIVQHKAYNVRADLNCDNKIDVRDVVLAVNANKALNT